MRGYLTHSSKLACSFVLACCIAFVLSNTAFAGTVALWLFDGPTALYPSCALTDASGNGYFLIMGRGAHLVDGRFGTALQIEDPRPLKISGRLLTSGNPTAVEFGLVQSPMQPGRTVKPMTWQTATFAALMTAGETHLRKPPFANPSDTRLNLGDFDWTIEFWFKASKMISGDGIVFEEGSGPRGENNVITLLALSQDRGGFEFVNQPSGTKLFVPSNRSDLQVGDGWHHFAFVYDAKQRQLRHYADGILQPLPEKAELRALPHGDEAYLSIGRDGLWKQPLPGMLDEMRISDDQVYRSAFTPPASRAPQASPTMYVTKPGPPLLFPSNAAPSPVIDLGTRKFLFIDDALIASKHNVEIVANPPKRMEKVIDRIRGHMSVVQDDSGTLRLYYDGPQDSLAVMTFRDGIHWIKPDLNSGDYFGARNIVLRNKVGLGNVFEDPNATPDRRWVYVSGIRREAIFVFTSADGYHFKRDPSAALPFSSGSQSVVYYDDQRNRYVGQHRSGYGEAPGGETSRSYVLSQVKSLSGEWPYTPRWGNATGYIENHKKVQSDVLNPSFLDNGPLTPPGFGAELPTVMGNGPQDPPDTDIYVTNAIKYPWAPDTYLGFPSVYFHYWGNFAETRKFLGEKAQKRGSGVVEVQLAVSRNGLKWHRFGRPPYVSISDLGRNNIHMQFVVQGLIKRGDEIWQYVGGHPGGGIGYHSAWVKHAPSPLYRLVQRMDGFAAAEGAYTGGTLTTKKLRFDGNHLELNIDTGAVGYAQVGLLDASGKPIPGYSVDDCIYINGDFLHTTVAWLNRGSDLSRFRGKTVQLVICLHGAKLFAMQFVP